MYVSAGFQAAGSRRASRHAVRAGCRFPANSEIKTLVGPLVGWTMSDSMPKAAHRSICLQYRSVSSSCCGPGTQNSQLRIKAVHVHNVQPVVFRALHKCGSCSFVMNSESELICMFWNPASWSGASVRPGPFRGIARRSMQNVRSFQSPFLYRPPTGAAVIYFL